MANRYTFQMQNPDEAEFTLHVTLRLKDWKRLKGEIDDSYPGHQLRAAISVLVLEAEKQFNRTEDADAPTPGAV